MRKFLSLAVFALIASVATFGQYSGTGTFAKVTELTDLEDGAYYVLYGINGSNEGALSNHENGQPDAVSVTFDDADEIVNPGVNIVWKLVANGANWRLYNEDYAKYCEITKNSTSGFSHNAEASTDYTVNVTDGDFDFVTNAEGDRAIAIFESDFRSYIANSSQLTASTINLYKIKPATEAFTVTFDAQGGTTDNATLTETSPGAGITLPAASLLDCGDWTFAGWATNIVGETSVMPTLLAEAATYYPTNNTTTLYAVYSKTVTGDSDAGNMAFGADELGITNSYNDGALVSETIGGVEIQAEWVCDQGSIQFKSAFGKLWNSGKFPQNITGIEINCSQAAATITFGNTAQPTEGETIPLAVGTQIYPGVTAAYDYFMISATGTTKISSINVMYGNQNSQVYNSNPACGPAPMTDFATFADFKANADTENSARIVGNMFAVFQNYKSMYVYDATDSVVDLIYGDKVKDGGYALENGQMISNVVGKYQEFNDAGQMVLDTIQTVGTKVIDVLPVVVEPSELTAADMHQYVRFENVEIHADVNYVSGSTQNGLVYIGGASAMCLRSQFRNIDASFVAGDFVNAEGFVSVYGGAVQIYLTKISGVAPPPVTVPAPTFSAAAGTYPEAFKLAIEAAVAPGAPARPAVFYSVDGSAPTVAYTDSILVDKSMTVKAIAVMNGDTSVVASADYVIESIPSGMTEVETFTEFETLEDTEDNVRITGTLTTVFQNFKSLYVFDGDDFELIYGDKVKDAGYDFGNGTAISNVVGKYQVYNGAGQMVLDTIETIGGYERNIVPLLSFPDAITAADIHQYVKFEGVELLQDVVFEEGTSTNAYILAGADTMVLRSQFRNIDASFVAGDLVDVEGFVSVYGGAVQIYLTKISGVAPPPVTVPAPTFSAAAGTYPEAFKLAIEAAVAPGAPARPAVFYSVDGSAPTVAYTDSILVDKSMTVKAIAVMNGDTSVVASADYVIDSTPTNNDLNAENEVIVYTENSNIVVAAHEGATIEVYSVSGACLFREVALDATTIINDMPQGVTVVVVDGKATKVVLK